MKLKNLILENFGLFRGKNEINLDTHRARSKEKPIVLIGGKNGAGKTTILEAIRLCLYGPRAVAERISTKDYDAYLRKRVHRDDSLLLNPTSAAVTLVFEHTHVGQNHEYAVTRSWDTADGSIQTAVDVLRDGHSLDEVDQEHAEDFLQDLVPPGVAQLYFFDGEKIQELAEAESSDAALSDAIKNLIGLELVDRLQADLKIYMNRLAKESASAKSISRLNELEKTIKQEKRRSVDLRKELDEANSKVDAIHKDIARKESRIAKEGGGYANKRETLEQKKLTHSKRISEIESDIRNHAENLLPFAIVPKLCSDLDNQLTQEKQCQDWNAVEELLGERAKGFKRKMNRYLKQQDGQVSAQFTKDFREKLKDALEVLSAPPKGVDEIELIHGIAPDQFSRLKSAIDKASDDVPASLAKHSKALEKESRELQKAVIALKKAPSEDQLRPLVESINDLHQQLGSMQTIVRQKETAYSSCEFAIADAERKHEKLLQAERDAGRLQQKQELAESVQKVLTEYQDELLAIKVKQLSESISQRFAELWRKGDRIKRMEIDPGTFEVSLFDRHGTLVPRQELSAGEKQMYAVAVLWGLADVSGRPLPMVIDTPLGRLDSDHRGHLVDRYFPHASHQVIILSTDTEIDREYFNQLQPHISHSIRLKYIPNDVRTKAEDGYFWKKPTQKKPKSAKSPSKKTKKRDLLSATE